MGEKNLTVDSLMKLWKDKLLPSIRDEIRVQVKALNDNIEALNTRCQQIEKSQDFLSSKYDQFIENFNTIKKQMEGTEARVNRQDETLCNVQDCIDELYSQVDEIQQYSRRDCVEIDGIPILPEDDPKQLVQEVASLIGVNVSEEHVSVVHRLPDSKNSKDRIIVKMVQRSKRDEIYRNRRKLNGKSIKDLPSVARQQLPFNVNAGKKIFINESLTPYRRRLFGRINAFKRENNFRFIWTMNGKVYLKQSENSRTFTFTTDHDFEAFEHSINT